MPMIAYPPFRIATSLRKCRALHGNESINSYYLELARLFLLDLLYGVSRLQLLGLANTQSLGLAQLHLLNDLQTAL